MRKSSLNVADAFLSLRDWFAPSRTVAQSAAPCDVSAISNPPDRPEANDAGEHRALLEQMRNWYARLDDALDAACERMLCEIASGVLARELRLAPCDLTQLISQLCAQTLGEPLRLRLHPQDCASWSGALPAIADATLQAGDAILELCEGSIDARLGVRFAAALAACTP